MPPIFKWMQFIQNNRKAFRLFDWICALGLLSYALYAESWGWGISGIITLLVAIFDPAGKVPALLQSRIVKRPEV